MDFVKGLKIKQRICNAYNDCSCYECPLGYNIDGIKDAVIDCDEFVLRHSQKAVEILEKWDKEHPQKLRKDYFFEKFPNAPKSDSEIPVVCAELCGFCHPEDCDQNNDCNLCWNTPIDESSGD